MVFAHTGTHPETPTHLVRWATIRSFTARIDAGASSIHRIRYIGQHPEGRIGGLTSLQDAQGAPILVRPARLRGYFTTWKDLKRH